MAPHETIRVPAFMRKKELQRKATSAKRTLAGLTRSATKIKMAAKKPVKISRPLKQPKMARGNGPKMMPVGMVTHLYDKISVAVLKLSSALKVGDTLLLVGMKGNFEQLVNSMQIEHLPVMVAKKGANIGIRVNQPVKPGKIAYRM